MTIPFRAEVMKTISSEELLFPTKLKYLILIEMEMLCLKNKVPAEKGDGADVDMFMFGNRSLNSFH